MVISTISSNLYTTRRSILDLSIMTIAGSIITVGTAVITTQKIVKNFRKIREEHNAKLLQAAKEEVAITKIKLESRIKEIESDLETLKITVGKDIEHVRENYATEIKNLGDKVDDIRSELRDQHIQILQLLTKMLGSRE